jgi:hypothetical protein
MGVITDERDEVIRALTRHCGDGRLTLDELEDRIGEAYAAETDEELRHVLRDLPVERVETPVEPEPTIRRTSLPPLPPLPPRPSMPPMARQSESSEWQKKIGVLCTVGGFVLLFNGMFILALLCWFVLPGVLLNQRGRCA